MSKVTNTLIITSKENFVWQSMQEIVPLLENLWLNSNTESHNVTLIDIDKTPINNYFKLLLAADNIVFTIFTFKISKFAGHLRKNLNLSIRYIFHLHGQATIACWPLFEWDMGHVLTESDIFISTCQRDQNTMDLVFKKHQTELIPFTLLPFDIKELSLSAPPIPQEKIIFVFIGRISPQKNLHLLLYAFYLLKKNLPEIDFIFDIFGNEDDLGSPNMEIDCSNYLEHLIELTEQLKLEKNISFKGFVPREKIYKNLKNKKHIFVSPSLHSDENFGIAAFRSLCLGNQVVLSSWGGHSDYLTHFPEQVELVNVNSSTNGPFINPFYLLKQLQNAVSKYTSYFSPQIPKYYSEKKITSLLTSLAITPSVYKGSPLERTQIAMQIHKNRNHFLKKNKNNIKSKQTQIFNNYKDKISHSFFEKYGMFDKDKSFSISQHLPVFPPWVSTNENILIIKDPRRGFFEIIIENDEPKQQIFNYDLTTNYIPNSIADDLISSGNLYVFSKKENTFNLTPNCREASSYN